MLCKHDKVGLLYYLLLKGAIKRNCTFDCLSYALLVTLHTIAVFVYVASVNYLWTKTEFLLLQIWAKVEIIVLYTYGGWLLVVNNLTIMFSLLYRAGEHSHHSSSTIHYVCWGFLHSQLHCGVRYSSSSEVDGIRWEPSGHKSSKQWCNSGWASDQWKQNLSVAEVSCTPYISGRPVHLPVCCEFTAVSENSH